MKFSELLSEKQEQRIDEIFGLGNSDEKEAVKKAIIAKIKDIKSVTLNVMHEILATLSKSGNTIAKKLIKELSFDPKQALVVYKKATK